MADETVKLKKGHVVALASGGPMMTVTGCGDNDVGVEWWEPDTERPKECGRYRTWRFPPEALRVQDEDDLEEDTVEDEDGFTINVKVNGLADVERLREAIEGCFRPPAVPRKDEPAYSDTFDSGSDHEPERCAFTVGDKLYSILARNARVVQEAIESACTDLNGKTQGPRFSVGDTVRLKSGGPRMTITELDGDSAYVTWLRRLDSLDSWDAVPRYDATGEDFPLSCLERA